MMRKRGDRGKGGGPGGNSANCFLTFFHRSLDLSIVNWETYIGKDDWKGSQPNNYIIIANGSAVPVGRLLLYSTTVYTKWVSRPCAC